MLISYFLLKGKYFYNNCIYFSIFVSCSNVRTSFLFIFWEDILYIFPKIPVDFSVTLFLVALFIFLLNCPWVN